MELYGDGNKKVTTELKQEDGRCKDQEEHKRLGKGMQLVILNLLSLWLGILLRHGFYL